MIALVVGMNVSGGAVDLVGLYVLAVLVNFCGFFWAGGIAMRFRTIQAAPLMQMPVFLILFFAPVYVPLDLLQGWISGVASVNPVTYLLETGAASSPAMRRMSLGAFALAIGLGVALLVVGVPRPAQGRGRGRLGVVEDAEERVDHLRVELRAGGFDEAAACLVDAERACGTGGRSSSRGTRRTRGRCATRAGCRLPTRPSG